jgi:hypothetical protein
MKSVNQKIALILGNGPSRQSIDLDTLKGKGTIFGCNALYRDWDGYDYLVAIDQRMINEIKQNNLDRSLIFPHEEECWEETTGRRNNAGMVAMREAIRRDHNLLYCFGFDFILDDKSSLSNIYKDSKNYEQHTQSNADDNYNRIHYLEWFVSQHTDVTFVFVIPDDVEVRTLGAKNVVGMKVSIFKEKLK